MKKKNPNKIQLTKPITLEQRKQILNKLYLSSTDIWLLIDGIGINQASRIAKRLCSKMKEKNMYDPSEPENWDGKSQRRYLVNTEFLRKEMKI